MWKKRLNSSEGHTEAGCECSDGVACLRLPIHFMSETKFKQEKFIMGIEKLATLGMSNFLLIYW